MKRRSFVAGLVALPAMTEAYPAFGWAAPEPVRTLMICTDIGPDTDPETLDATLSAFAAGGMPIHLLISSDGPSDRAMQPASPIAALLRRYLATYPGLMELVAFSPDLGRIPPFETARAAERARDAIVHAIWAPGSQDAALARIGTIACAYVEDPTSVAGVASAGFRNVLAIADRPTEVVARMTNAGVLSLSGGDPVLLRDAAALLPTPHPAKQRMITFSAVDLAKDAPTTVTADVNLLVAAMVQAEMDQQSAPLRARDLQMRIISEFRREIGLHIFDTQAVPNTDILAFRKMLNTKRIRYSVGPPLQSVTQPNTATDAYWIAAPQKPFRAGQDQPRPISVIHRTNTAHWASTDDMPTGMATVLVVDPMGPRGIDATASLHVPILAHVDGPTVTGASFLPAIDSAEGGVVIISASAIATAATRSSLLKLLESVTETAGTTFLPLNEYVGRLLPQDPLLPTLMRTAAFQMRAPALRPSITATDREALMLDARAAWNYFKVATNASTGLCPSSMTFGTSYNTDYRFLTMWDIGSQINALMAAVDLRLIDETDFTNRCNAIIKALERSSRGRLNLPPEEVSPDTGRARSTQRFNSFDTGRLLLALDQLRRFRLPIKRIEDLVSSWDLASVVVDGRFNSIQSGQRVDDYSSNYSSYAAAGLRAWGIEAKSPFDDMTAVSQADAKIALLATVATLGPIGAEPALLHLLDVGHHPAEDYLSDVLMAAQLEEWDEKGQLMAPSETPIDRSPWFTYQGLALDGRANPWAVEAEFVNEEQRALATALRAVSSKAPFLWHALRPSAFTERLVTFVRERARTAQGYKSAVYLAPNVVMSDYFDINTSGIILQATARALARDL